jgi:hypothetical protein
MLSRPRSLFGASALFLASLALTSCGGQDDLTPLIGTWNGSYSTDDPANPAGSIMLVFRPGAPDGVDGRFVFYRNKGGFSRSSMLISRTSETFYLRTGQFAVFPARVSASISGLTLSGDLVLADSADGVFSVERLPDRPTTITPFLSLPSAVQSMAFDTTMLWISTTSEGLIRISPSGSLIDTVEIPFGKNLHRTSSLAYDGERLWTHTLVDSSFPTNKSRLLPFTRHGIEGEGLVIPHLSSGLAYDGNNLWSLSRSSQKLYEVNLETAAFTDSIHLPIPDLYHLEYFGDHFWALGYLTEKIYKIDLSGEVIAVFDIAVPGGWVPAGGIASDGESLYFAQNAGNGSIIYRITPQTGS